MAKMDAIALLEQDHDEVDELITQFERLGEGASPQQRKLIAEQICELLTIHAEIEEEVFYPAVEEQVPDTKEMVAEARVEHNAVKNLISDIQHASPESEEFTANVKVLGELVNHHVQEEEDELFPKVRDSELDLDALGQQLQERKQDLMNQSEVLGSNRGQVTKSMDIQGGAERRS
jgi:hemerythrin superfamily protein